MIRNEIRDSLKKTCFALNNQQVEYLLIGQGKIDVEELKKKRPPSEK